MKTFEEMTTLGDELYELQVDRNRGNGVSNAARVAKALQVGDWHTAVWVAKSGASVLRFYPDLEEFYLKHGLLQESERWGR